MTILLKFKKYILYMKLKYRYLNYKYGLSRFS